MPNKITKKKIKSFLSHKYYQLTANLKGKVVFNDRFGLTYYLWPDTRLKSTIDIRVRTDDTGVIQVINTIINELAKTDDDILCIDIGAFIGVISLAMAKNLKDKGFIISFEPFKKNYRRLIENIYLNSNKNIFPFNAAISNKTGYCKLSVGDGGPGNEFIVKNEDSSLSNNYELAIQTTLDHFTFAYNINKINLLKIDAEGMDENVLHGSQNLLQNNAIDYIIVEYLQGERSSENVLNILSSHKYNFFYIVRNGQKVVADISKYPSNSHKPPLNLLAVSSQAKGKEEIVKELLNGSL